MHSSTVTRRCVLYSAAEGQASAHWKQLTHFARSTTGLRTISSPFAVGCGSPTEIAPWGHAFMHSAHWSMPMQRMSIQARSGPKVCDSGLWHQRQRSGQPFVKMSVRMPGPS